MFSQVNFIPFQKKPMETLEMIEAKSISYKNLKKCLNTTFFFFFLFHSNHIYSQSEYNMYLTETVLVNPNTIEFEVYIQSLNDNFILTSYQCTFWVDQDIENGGKLTFEYVDSTSHLSNLPGFVIGLNNLDGHRKLTFASFAGLDVIKAAPIMVGRFRIHGTEEFTTVNPNITWDFGGTVPTMLTGETYQNITLPINHGYNFTLGFNSQADVLPKEHKLLQNYPNPFNPTTKISFSLLKEADINLTIYNVLGQEIKNIINDRFNSGTHTVIFEGKGLSNGLYFCKLKVDNKSIGVIKMILLK